MRQVMHIGGRPALVIFMDEMMVPVDDPDEATLAKAVFTDADGGSLFLKFEQPPRQDSKIVRKEVEPAPRSLSLGKGALDPWRPLFVAPAGASDYIKFDPDQPRDEYGRWTDGGGSDL